jgi:hypothetical protein
VKQGDKAKCRHCGEPIVVGEHGWKHTNGFYTCVEGNVPTYNWNFGAEPESESEPNKTE